MILIVGPEVDRNFPIVSSISVKCGFGFNQLVFGVLLIKKVILSMDAAGQIGFVCTKSMGTDKNQINILYVLYTKYMMVVSLHRTHSLPLYVLFSLLQNNIQGHSLVALGFDC